MKHDVTERDFRMPEFKDAKAEDYEFRADGKVVRKDRWEMGIRQITGELDIRGDFEISDVVSQINTLVYIRRLFIKAISFIDDIHINTASEVDSIKALKKFIDLHRERLKDEADSV